MNYELDGALDKRLRDAEFTPVIFQHVRSGFLRV
jgi:hypothetical protein